MKVTQIYEILNSTIKETLGETAVVNEDLSNIVDVGNEVFDAAAVDNYVKKLVNHIGKVIFEDRVYQGSAPSVMMDAWEFGSVLEKISSDLPEAQTNDTWGLQSGTEYKQDIFYQPTVSAKFYNSRITFEIPMSITERQVKESFSNANQLNGFITMLYNSVDKAMTINLDNLIMRTINAMTGATLNEGNAVRCVNLLKDYNAKYTKELTADKALYDADFIRYASYVMGMYKDRMAKISTLFNMGGKERFTPSDMLHVVLLSDFAKAADTFLKSDTYHNEMVSLPNYESVAYWQGSGTNYDFADTSSINVKLPGGEATVNKTGIIGVMFDRDALGVSNLDRRVTSTYNAKGEFYNNFYKFDCGFFNDENENFVVFYVADGE